MIKSSKRDKRFEVVKSETIKLGSGAMILRDKLTGVLYLYVGSGYGGGLTPLLDNAGKPVIDKYSE